MQYPAFDWERPSVEGMSVEEWVDRIEREVFRPSSLYIPLDMRNGLSCSATIKLRIARQSG
jgi:hypothetical protein